MLILRYLWLLSLFLTSDQRLDEVEFYFLDVISRIFKTLFVRPPGSDPAGFQVPLQGIFAILVLCQDYFADTSYFSNIKLHLNDCF